MPIEFLIADLRGSAATEGVIDDRVRVAVSAPFLAVSLPSSCWTADGRGIFVFKREGLPARIFRLDPWTGKKELVKEFMPADPGGITGMSSVTMSPCGPTT